MNKVKFDFKDIIILFQFVSFLLFISFLLYNFEIGKKENITIDITEKSMAVIQNQ